MTFENEISMMLTESEIDYLRALISDEMSIASMGADDKTMDILNMLHLKLFVKKRQLNE
tara:strand:+ start:946 stop:1122 length:177 start_codon:yes stop_codon:yes gene_type:complete